MRSVAKSLEKNIIDSFKLAKEDFLDLQKNFIDMSKSQKYIIEMIKELRNHEIQIYSAIKELYQKEAIKELHNHHNDDIKLLISELKQSENKIITLLENLNKKESKVYLMKKPSIATKKKNKIYLSAKNSKKFHETNCPFAKNIRPKNRITFKTKSKALNQGLKPCSCVKN